MQLPNVISAGFEAGELRTSSAQNRTGDIGGEALFESLLMPIGDLAGGAKMEGLLNELRLDRHGHLQRTLTEATTIHQTSFFRDLNVFAMLRRVILPRMMKARQEDRRLRFWCAGCSTGQEAYSVAMMLLDGFPEIEGWDVRVRGTDISREVIAYAQSGRYRPMELMDGLEAGVLAKYFEARGGDWEAGSGLRALCSFEYGDLCGPVQPEEVFDLILMRNVLMYLDADCRNKVFEQLRGQIAGDGYLVLGNMEQAEEAQGSFDEGSAAECYFYRPVPAA